jgi:CheY-like chemotaxis protein
MTLILIIDDAAFSRRMIRKSLQADNYEILEAATGREGLETAFTQYPDCILTDLLMPDMDGLEVLKALQAKESKIPVVIISADIQDGTRDRGLSLGAKAFINKPVKAEELRKAVRQALGQE